MLRLTKHRMSRIPNKLAFFAALMLLVTAAAGVSKTLPDSFQAPELAARAAANSGVQTEAIEPVKKDKGFKMSLYLFRFSR